MERVYPLYFLALSGPLSEHNLMFYIQFLKEPVAA